MKARILIVEDEYIVQLDLQSRLRRLGYSVVGVASEGEEAIAKAAELSPDLVLMDVRLEGPMDGIEAARQIRAARPIPVLYVTAYTDASQQGGSQELRPCLSKPFLTPQLHDAITQALALEKPTRDN